MSTQNINIESHKLMYHPKHVSSWLENKNIYPIEIEVSPTGGCNHRCVFCALDYVGYEPVIMDVDVLIKNFKEIHQEGLKSVILSGEGEPLLNKNIDRLITETNNIGIDVAISTNGVLLDENLSAQILKHLTWIRFSVAAAKEATYKKIHNSKSGDFAKVLNNLESAVKTKRDNRLRVTLGVQLLLTNDNADEVVELAETLKKIGVDYFTVKPFSKHPKSDNNIIFDYSNVSDIASELSEIATSEFAIYFRSNTMKKKNEKKPYKKCYGLPFMTHIDAKGNIWPCVAFVGSELSYGNVYEQSFKEIWAGKKRAEINAVFDKMDLDRECRELCRLDEINRYLNQLKNPVAHVNFI